MRCGDPGESPKGNGGSLAGKLAGLGAVRPNEHAVALARHGRGPVVGLDYNVLLRFLDRMDLSDSDYDQMLNDISVLEDAALTEIHTQSP
jgi:hypothetical protein